MCYLNRKGLLSIRPLPVLAFLLFGSVALPADPPSKPPPPEDRSGLVVRLDLWSVTPRNADIAYAFVDDSEKLFGGGLVQAVDYEQDTIAVVYAGWRLATSPATELGLRFWEYDGESDGSTGDAVPGSVGPLLTSPEFKLIGVDSAEIEARVKSTFVEGGAVWTHEIGRSGKFGFGAGIRFFGWEQVAQVRYEKSQETIFGGEETEEFINSSAKASGIGPAVHVSYRQGFGRRFEAGGRFGVAAPVGDIEFLVTDEFSSLRNTFAGPVEEFKATQAEDPGSRRAFVQFDLGLEIGVRIARDWRATLAYAVHFWPGIPAGFRFVDDVSQSTAVPAETEVVFEGARIGISYRF